MPVSNIIKSWNKRKFPENLFLPIQLYRTFCAQFPEIQKFPEDWHLWYCLSITYLGYLPLMGLLLHRLEAHESDRLSRVPRHLCAPSTTTMWNKEMETKIESYSSWTISNQTRKSWSNEKSNEKWGNQFCFLEKKKLDFYSKPVGTASLELISWIANNLIFQIS